MTEHIQEERNKDFFFISQVYLLIFWLFLSLSPRNLCISAHAKFFFLIKIIAHDFLDLIFIEVA